MKTGMLRRSQEILRRDLRRVLTGCFAGGAGGVLARVAEGIVQTCVSEALGTNQPVQREWPIFPFLS